MKRSESDIHQNDVEGFKNIDLVLKIILIADFKFHTRKPSQLSYLFGRLVLCDHGMHKLKSWHIA